MKISYLNLTIVVVVMLLSNINNGKFVVFFNYLPIEKRKGSAKTESCLRIFTKKK